MTPESLSQDLLHGTALTQRRALAKAITLLESTHPDHQTCAETLLQTLLPYTGKALRLGISGAPGVGKSTFIEALGLYLTEQGKRVAVLAIDPSSARCHGARCGGAILGDKTRMQRLSVHAQAYIRPSPSSGTLGGVAEKTRESILVCEAAGYDVVLVETVGVGQSEIMVANMTDLFVLMQLPNAGDDLQAMKKGIMELADLVLINKVDLDAQMATRAQAHIVSVLQLLHSSKRMKQAVPTQPDVDVTNLAAGMHTNVHTNTSANTDTNDRDNVWIPKVLQLSALTGTGVSDFWQQVQTFVQLQRTSDAWHGKRAQQNLAWMWERIQAGLRTRLEYPQAQKLLSELGDAVQKGELLAPKAAQMALDFTFCTVVQKRTAVQIT